MNLTICYTNWKGSTRVRVIKPVRVYFGSTEWHPEPQWLLEAIDMEVKESRTFAMEAIHYMRNSE